MIEIVKASAGSGKTFSLAKKYISLLFDRKGGHSSILADMKEGLSSENKERSHPYRHILAVTFTNKATDEMKSRILSELHRLAKAPETSPYAKDFLDRKLFPDMETIRRSAEQMLCDILHDYGNFSVCTIDKFFQQTLRAFSREIGQFATYQIELDRDSLVRETVDRVLDSLTDSSPLLKWLTESAMDRINQGERYNLEPVLYNMACRLKSDEHRVKAAESGASEEEINKAREITNLDAVRKECDKIIKDFEKKVLTAAKNVENGMCGLCDKDFLYKFIRLVHSYAAPAKGKLIEQPSDSFLSRALSPDDWFSKANAGRLLAGAREKLEEPLKSFCALFVGNDGEINEEYRAYSTAFIIRGQLYSLGITGELSREFTALMKEKNVLSIDESNLILRDIIAGSDAPFVYEKTGVRYENFLLDEFQDTSEIQWENLSPLLHESDSNGNENFIVGDVKQSIYRWRGSNWSLLAEGLKNDKFQSVKISSLGTNYRSLQNVVMFNNEFFRFASAALDGIIGETEFITGIYEDVEQKCPKEEAGSVSVTFCSKDDELDKVVEAIEAIRGAGARLDEIMVLVRRNGDGVAVAEHLIDKGISVVTNDSLRVKSSLTVSRLVSLLSSVDNPFDTVGAYLAKSLEISVPKKYQSMLDLCEELIRDLREHDQEVFDSETAYIRSFMDAVSDYVAVHGNSLHGFLEWWNDADPAISSPDGGEAVKVITVHKAKGLQAPYVIFPFAEGVELYRGDRHWCIPREGELPDVCKGIYDVNLSAGCMQTLFDKDYFREQKSQAVDNINVFYVALTRAEKGMHIIAATPPKKIVGYGGGPDIPDFHKLSDALYIFLKGVFSGERGGIELSKEGDDGEETYRFGELPEFVHREEDRQIVSSFRADYFSWPINPPGEPQRLLLSREYSDFFSGEESPGSSPRLRGIVLHDILSSVKKPDDLKSAVDQAVMNGELNADEAGGAESLLRKGIETVQTRGWFAEDAEVRNETEVIDTDGNIYRPDRVEIHPDGEVVIIDYKFGKHHRAYEEQIAKYAEIWRNMGYGKVSAYLWYVFSGEVKSSLS